MREIERIAVGSVDSAIKIEASTDPNPVTGVNSKYDFWLRAYGQWQKAQGSSIKFHEGQAPLPGSSLMTREDPAEGEGPNGITHEVLIEVILDRLRAFQKGKCSCRENAFAIECLEVALLWLQKRATDRIRRGVEGRVNVP